MSIRSACVVTVSLPNDETLLNQLNSMDEARTRIFHIESGAAQMHLVISHDKFAIGTEPAKQCLPVCADGSPPGMVTLESHGIALSCAAPEV